MIFEEVNKLTDEVLEFLQSCGGAYETISSDVVYNIIECIAWNQYIWTEDCFVCYWKILPKDIELIQDRIKPVVRTSGSVMYVVECASKRRGLSEIVKELRKQAVGMRGVLWHRPLKLDKLYYFPSQRGEERIENGK